MLKAVPWLRRRADDVAVLLLGAMFASFIVQIVSRYVLNHPLGWTLEMCLTTWLWTVFWASSFCLKHDDHIRFDMLYNAVGRRTRRVFAALSAVCVIAAMGVAIPGTWDFVSFLTIKRSATLRIPLAYVFSIYLLFMGATIAWFGYRLWRVLRHDEEPGRVSAEVTP
jgi:C4-dicarboxylate transporter, DctQ subunit